MAKSFSLRALSLYKYFVTKLAKLHEGLSSYRMLANLVVFILLLYISPKSYNCVVLVEVKKSLYNWLCGLGDAP